jgi:gliding motility-associated transport system ATP-binding protein
VPGVLGVSIADRHNGAVGYEVSTESGRDVRKDLARAVVSRNWGLLELRPSRMSLEEIFLSLTTEEKPAEKEEKIPERSND